MRYGFICLSLFCSSIYADPYSLWLMSEQGEKLSLQVLASGELWGSFFLSDNTLGRFDSHELVILQVDNHKPIKLEQGLRSCGAPAGKAQQIDYLFTHSDAAESDWQFQSNQSSEPVLKLLGWDDAKYDKVEADLRETVVDFPVREQWFYQQIVNANKLSFRYTTTDGQMLETVFRIEKTVNGKKRNSGSFTEK